MKAYIPALGILSVIAILSSGCRNFVPHNLPPASRLMHPGPGVGGPGPGVMMHGGGAAVGGGMMQAAYSQIAFIGPEGMTITWDVAQPGAFDSEPLIAPGRQNFPQGGVYRLKLTNIPGRAGEEMYPTLEVGPSTPRTDAYLAHTPIPIQLNEEDLDQVLGGNFVTKVIYLPDPEFQELALTGVETLVSTQLGPGVDPIEEADNRGAILAILRLGNKDLELPGGNLTQAAVVPASYHAAAGPALGPAGPALGPHGSAMSPAGHSVGMPTAHAAGAPMGIPAAAFAPPALPPQLAGGAGPQWGMPMSGTPIGLPGPPHVPLGVPAGLKRHVVKNHTRYHIPQPNKRFNVHVKQRPGFSYPKPPKRMFISESVTAPFKSLLNPWSNKREIVHH